LGADKKNKKQKLKMKFRKVLLDLEELKLYEKESMEKI